MKVLAGAVMIAASRILVAAMLLLVISRPVLGDDAFVNTFRCEGEGPGPEKRQLKNAPLIIASSGDGYSLNVHGNGRVYSGFGIARHNRRGLRMIAFGLTDAKGEGTLAGVLQQARDPQGRAIAGAITVVYAAMRSYKDYDAAPGRLMCHAGRGG